MNTVHPMPYRAHALALLRLGLPLVGSSIAGFAIHMTDTVLLGWYSVLSLAAATIATSLWFIVFILGAGFAQAVMPVVAAAVAEGDEVRARRVTRMALWLSLAYALLTLPLFWNSAILLQWMGQTPEVAAEGQRFLRIAGFSMLPALWGNVFRSYLSAQHLTGVQLVVTIAMVLLNVGTAYGLIFGFGGFEGLGIVGAGIASVIINTLTVLALGAYAQWRLPHYHLFQRIWRADWPAMADLFRIGAPIGLTSLAESGLFAASAMMMGWIGEVPLAAHGIALQLAAFMFMFHVGMSQAATIRAGGALGRHDATELRRGALAAHAVSTAFAIIVVAIFLSFPENLVSLYVDPAEPQRDALMSIGRQLVLLAALFQLADATQVIALGLLRGVQDTTVPMWLASVSYWLIGLPLGYVLAFPLGYAHVGLWLGLTAGLTAAAASLVWRFWTRAVRI